MISSQGTQVQGWSKGLSVTLLLFLLALHAACVVLVILYCPDLFRADKYQGGHCETRAGETVALLPCEGCDTAGCVSKSEGEHVALSNIIMSYKFPRGRDLNVWNWRLTASLSIYFKLFGTDLVGEKEDNSSVLTNLDYFEQRVELSASIDYALNSNLEEATPISSPWHSKAIVRHINRTLQCRYIRPPEKPESQESEIPFLCTLSPLLELFPLSNSSYVTSVRVERLVGPSEVNLLESNGTLVSYLTIVTETELFHQLRFYCKCIFFPVILFSLVWFLVRLCMNDLYVNIPDRLIITAAVAQLINNMPTELLVAHLPSPHLMLVDPVVHIFSFSSLALFWIVFTLDKLADNEPWERTTRYYWRCLTAVLSGTGLAVTTAVYLHLPLVNNPFNNHWQPQTTTLVSLGLIFSLAVVVAGFQCYLSIIICRVICDISIHYPTTSRAWRLKGVLVYNLAVSLVVSLGSVLHLVLSLCLHWNPEFHTDPLPFGISAAGAVLLIELVAVNTHVVFLLLALSRSAAPGEGWYAPVRPAMYSLECREEQLHLWDLSALPSPLHKLG